MRALFLITRHLNILLARSYRRYPSGITCCTPSNTHIACCSNVSRTRIGVTGSVISRGEDSSRGYAMNRAQQTEMLESYNRSIHDDGGDVFEKLLVHQITRRKASPKDRSQQEARRARARENALMQLHNKGRPKGLGWSMNSLRGSLQLCSIENTGWAAKEDILNVLMEAGVSKRDSDVLLSTSQGQKSSSWVMYWPEVMRFLEEGPTTQPNKSLTAKAPSTELDEASRGREWYERVEIDTLKNPANSKLGNISNIPNEVKSSQNHQSTALDREHVTPCHGDLIFTSERRENEGCILEQKSAVSTSRDQLEQSLLELENSVRMTEFGEGPVVHYQRLTEVIKKVRAVLRVAAVDDDIPSSPENGKNATTTTTKTTVRSEGRSIADDGPKRLTNTEVDSPKDSPVGSTLAVDDMSTSLKDIREAESLAAEACAAGKRGDIGALQGIPNDERWECSKSALTEEIRRYLNGGYVARNMLEGPPTTRPGIDSVKTVELGQPPSTPKDVVSIASLFEWGDGSDY